MWKESLPEDYDNFRTFIMGTKNQPMFPKGVVYEGVREEPFYLRGESGANDSIIPALDNLLQVTDFLPDNPLTEVLKDFRGYRPPHHTEFLEWIHKESRRLKIREYCFRDPKSTLYYYALLD